MKLELLSLRAVNCGPLKDVVIDFSDGNGHARPVTLLAGANGSGKTTVLELIPALAELLLLETVPFRQMIGYGKVEPHYLPPKNILGRSEYARINLLVEGTKFAIAFGDKPKDETFGDEFFYLTRTKRASWCQVSKDGDLWEDLQNEIRELTDSNNGFLGGNSKVDFSDPQTPSFIFFPHNRSLNKVEATELVQAPNIYEWVYHWKPATEFRGSLESYLIWLEYSEPDTFNAAKDVVSTLFPQKKNLAIERKRLKVVIDLQDGSRHDLDQLSSGEQNLLITLIELRRRLIPGSIVLFDEIENSLHAAFQHRMAQGLLRLQREVPFQLIVTSHAEAFVDALGVENTLILTEF